MIIVTAVVAVAAPRLPKKTKMTPWWGLHDPPGIQLRETMMATISNPRGRLLLVDDGNEAIRSGIRLCGLTDCQLKRTATRAVNIKVPRSIGRCHQGLIFSPRHGVQAASRPNEFPQENNTKSQNCFHPHIGRWQRMCDFFFNPIQTNAPGFKRVYDYCYDPADAEPSA
jgi:hypothetical protein